MWNSDTFGYYFYMHFYYCHLAEYSVLKYSQYWTNSKTSVWMAMIGSTLHGSKDILTQNIWNEDKEATKR